MQRSDKKTNGHDRCNVLGVGISAINMEMAVDTINRWIAEGEKHYVTVTGVHGVMESQADEELRQIHNDAGMVTPDGMPMVWANRLAGNRHVSRVYGPDLTIELCANAVRKGHRLFFYGGAEGVADLLAEKLTKRFPALQVAGTYCPPFRPLNREEEDEVIEKIAESKADIVFVGLSTPKQERWMATYGKRLAAPVCIGVGAAFDFHAGLKKQAPRWMQRTGMEWFFRMVTEPRRLAKRYLYNNPRFVVLFVLQKFRIKRFPIDKDRPRDGSSFNNRGIEST